MKIAKTLTATLMASTLLLGATACTSGSGENTSSEPKVEQTENTEAKDKKEIVETVDSFYAYMADGDNLNALADSAEKIEATNDDEVAAELKKNSPETFVFFDAYDTQTIANSFSYLAETAMLNAMDIVEDIPEGEKSTAVYSTPEEAVTVNGETATVDKSKIVVSNLGEGNPDKDAAHDGDDTEIDLVKKDGKWLIKAPTVDLKTGERVEK